jgi:hypothetical protein
MTQVLQTFTHRVVYLTTDAMPSGRDMRAQAAFVAELFDLAA